MGREGLDEFLECQGFTQEEFDSTGLDWDELRAIAAHHAARAGELQSIGSYVSQRLQQLPTVHSLKVRVKDPDHLIAKIVRKALEPGGQPITLDDYRLRVTDLVGLRVLHLFKDQWRSIHDFVVDNWELNEAPIAYFRAGDPEPLLDAFRAVGCTAIEHKFGYRSIHYLIRSQPDKEVHVAELQVRTIFEEGWSEIDHRVRYPRFSSDPYLTDVLTIFNRLAGSADEIGTFIKALSSFLVEQRDEIAARDERLAKTEAELKKVVSQLQISTKEKSKLEKKISELRDSSLVGAGDVFSSSRLLATGSLSNAMISAGGTSLFGTTEKTCSKCNKTYSEDSLIAYASGTSLCPDCRKTEPWMVWPAG